ncbi:MAG: signal recognition particle-docking protein FtsY [Puniceicoccaceae bacterium]
MLGIFKRFKAGLAKTTTAIGRTLGGVFGNKRLDAASLEKIEEALYGADIGVETAGEIVQQIEEAARTNRDLRGKEAAAIGATVLRQVLDGSDAPFDIGEKKAGSPRVILLVGVNGAGKTTTAAKLAAHYQAEGVSVLLAACDTFRAAANEQLVSWANRLGVELVASHHGADAAAVAFDAHAAAIGRKAGILICDTAGRLHTKSNLMGELKKIQRVLAKQDPEAPHECWLVVDGSLGTNSIEQARVFHREIGLTGLVVTKLDGTSKGGALVGIYRELNLPIRFVGLGEQPTDLQVFESEAYIQTLLGLDEEEE